MFALEFVSQGEIAGSEECACTPKEWIAETATMRIKRMRKRFVMITQGSYGRFRSDTTSALDLIVERSFLEDQSESNVIHLILFLLCRAQYQGR